MHPIRQFIGFVLTSDQYFSRALKQLVKVYLKDAKHRRDLEDEDGEDSVRGVYQSLSEKMDEKRLVNEVTNIFLNGYIPVSEGPPLFVDCMLF